MIAEDTKLEGVKLLKPRRFGDERGFFAESYSLRNYLEIGIDAIFVQDNHSISSAAGTVRGLHFQAPPKGQAKLVRCGRGAIFDVAVDLRRGSPTFGGWVGLELSADNGAQLFIPEGLAHGFVTLEANSEIVYKCSEYYAPEAEGSLRWDDPDIGIEWPLNCAPVLSEKDSTAPFLAEFESPFTFES